MSQENGRTSFWDSYAANTKNTSSPLAINLLVFKPPDPATWIPWSLLHHLPCFNFFVCEIIHLHTLDETCFVIFCHLEAPWQSYQFQNGWKGQKRQSNLAKKLDFDLKKSWVSMVLKYPIPHSNLCAHSCPWPQFLGSARRLLQSTRRIRKYMTTSRSGSISAVGIHGNLTTYLSKKDVKLSITKHDSDLHRKVPALVGKIARYLSQAAVFTSPSL